MSEVSTELFKKIRRIQIQTTRLANDILAGAYHSAFKGKGMEFEEVREYLPGDEIRSIDWNVTARMAHPYVKNFREEREITVMLVVDVSHSCRFGSVQLKSDLIAEIGAVIAFSAIKNHDKIGLILFTGIVEKYIPPKKGVRHVLRIIRELLAFEPIDHGTNLAQALSFLGKVQRRSGVCFLISDFLCSNYSHELAITAKKHDLISIGITDPYEITFPSMDLLNITDLETGKNQTIDTSDSIVHESFKKLASERILTHEKMIAKMGAGFIDIRTDKAYLEAFKKFFKMREKKK